MEFAKLMNIYLNHWPKYEKYALANRIRSTAKEETMNDTITDESYRSPDLQRNIAQVTARRANRKLDIISNCFECSWYSKNEWCGKSQRDIEWRNDERTGFPWWCKLEDA